jgi:uncharacterized protein
LLYVKLLSAVRKSYASSNRISNELGPQVLEKLASAERELARPVNPTIYSVAEFKSKLTSKSHFINSVARGPKVFLLGDEDELRKIVRG